MKPPPELSIDTIRTLSMDAVQKANAGHPGTAMALAPVAYLLYKEVLRLDPADPEWPNRDRFVLSAGHACVLQYAALHLAGYDLTLEDLEGFRQYGSRTPGHPELHHTPGVETTTGPLGQGVANAVGMAAAEHRLAAEFNRPGHEVIDHRTYAICSDGDLMEGVSGEASSLAGHLRLGKLTLIYDDNHITIEGTTNLAFSEDVAARYASYGWHVQRYDDTWTLDTLREALAAAEADPRPSMIVIRTHIAYGAPNKQDTAAAHGAPLGEDEVRATKEVYGWPPDAHFLVPDEVRAHCDRREDGGRLRAAWQERFDAYRQTHPELAAELLRRLRGELPAAWDADLPVFEPGTAIATRAASGKVLNAIAARVPELVGGSADLAPSNNTDIRGAGSFEADDAAGRNFHFGIREHGMGGILNGMAVHGGYRVFGATFLVFSDYMRGSVRLAALMGLPVTYIWTHDSVWLGEDGPTHQPVEHLMALRAIPNLTLIRPAEATETAEAWRVAMEHTSGPVALVLTRQGLPTLDRDALAPAAGVRRGGYVLADAEGGTPDAIVIATGSEVTDAMLAREALAGEGIDVRVVSLPSWELFEAQDPAYRAEVLPPDITARVSLEAGTTFGWERYVGAGGRALGIDRFGASGPGQVVARELGISSEAVVAAVRDLVGAPAGT